MSYVIFDEREASTDIAFGALTISLVCTYGAKTEARILWLLFASDGAALGLNCWRARGGTPAGPGA